MKIFTFIICILLLNSNNLFAQENNGYYNKKFFVQAQCLINTPFFYNLFSEESIGYKNSNGLLEANKDRLNVGFRASVGYAVKRNFGLMFEYGQDFSSVYLSNDIQYYDSLDYYGYPINPRELIHESLKLKTNVFVGVMEFANKNALLPMGLSHQVGLGFSSSNIVNQNYRYDLAGQSIYNSVTGNYDYIPKTEHVYDDPIRDPLDIKNLKSVNRLILLYALSIRTPLTKSLLLNYGIKYTLNLPLGVDTESIDYQSPYDIEHFVMSNIKRHRMMSFINANIGIVYAF